MQLVSVSDLTDYQKLVTTVSRILIVRRFTAKSVRLEDVMGVVLTHPKVMRLADAAKLRETDTTQMYSVFQNVRRNISFRQNDFFVGETEIHVKVKSPGPKTPSAGRKV